MLLVLIGRIVTLVPISDLNIDNKTTISTHKMANGGQFIQPLWC